ncbi:MAG TPA: efflux RND transporter permease subunit [Chlamydiales bacterium]|nr:efflux RND transporter permease subunit [Chlamydiales bacterium]
MNLSEPFIRRPVMTILVMATIFVFGILAYQALPVSDLPNVDMPTIEVTVSYPGASPQTMANSVATPLEQQFSTIEGMQTIFSSSNTGSTSIVLQFNLERNIDAASTDVQAAISRAEPNLPSDLPNNPVYEKVNPAATPILYFVLYSENMTAGQLYDYGNTFIGQRLSMVEGVSQVITYGSPYAVRVQVDPERLAGMNVGISDVTAVLQEGNVDLPLGTLWGQKDDCTVDADGQLFTAEPYGELVIKAQDGTLVKVKDVGRALDSVQNDKLFNDYITREGKYSCIILGIQRLPGSNTIKVIQGIKSILEQMKPQIPDTLKIITYYDQSKSILEGVDDVKMTLVFAFILVVIIIYLFLGKLLNTIIPALAIPLAICGTCALMLFYGFSIDLLSLLAITLSIGFLVDDAIVVLENNVRHVQMGEAPVDASIRGSKEISTTVLSMTLCLTAAFIPMLFMGGVVGKLFREFAVTIVTVVLISGFISLSLTPLLCSRFIRPYANEKKTRMEELSDRLMERMRNFYKPLLIWALDHRLIMLSLGLFSIVCSAALYFVIPKDFIPEYDVGFIQGFTLSRDGTSPYLMNKYHDKLNEMIMADPNVDSVVSISSYTNPNEGIVFLSLKPYADRQPLDMSIKELTAKAKEIPGINAYFSSIPLINLQVGTTAKALYQYSLTSIDQNSLYQYAPQLLNKVKANSNFSQVSSDLRIHQPQWFLHILRDRASYYGITAKDIEDLLTYAYSNNKISQINGVINQYNVLIETLPKFYKDPTVLPALYIKASKSNGLIPLTEKTSTLVPLAEVVEAKETVGPLTVNHVNGLPAVGISFNPGEGVPLGTMLNTLHNLAAQDKPPQIYGQVIGTAQIFNESLKSLSFLMILSFFVIYIVLGILYESFIHPLTVMSALPPTLVGGLFSLLLFRETLSLYSFVGLILLIGIVLKNGIMMVDFAIVAVEKEKKTPRDAIIEASLIRFRPILMTTLAAMMGAVPIALGIGSAFAKSIQALGICIVGGLIISQLLTLLLTPVLYYYFEILQENAKNWLKSRKTVT